MAAEKPHHVSLPVSCYAAGIDVLRLSLATNKMLSILALYAPSPLNLCTSSPWHIYPLDARAPSTIVLRVRAGI